jgi:hypothetical protein
LPPLLRSNFQALLARIVYINETVLELDNSTSASVSSLNETVNSLDGFYASSPSPLTFNSDMNALSAKLVMPADTAVMKTNSAGGWSTPQHHCASAGPRPWQQQQPWQERHAALAASWTPVCVSSASSGAPAAPHATDCHAPPPTPQPPPPSWPPCRPLPCSSPPWTSSRRT